jgi:uncharacterized protein YdeI (YjbR/CyaY-like superfamily)
MRAAPILDGLEGGVAMSNAYEQMEVTSASELRAWLEAHHATVQGIWLVTWKKKAGPDRYVSYEEVVREALCFGWIDSLGRALDEDRSQLLLTPRKARSNWSRPNKIRVAELTAAGRMAPAGLDVVAAARESGTWTALDDVEALVEPEELRLALDARPEARGHWDAFPRSTKRATLEWISAAKRAETRTQRITKTVALAADNLRANQWPPTRGR